MLSFEEKKRIQMLFTLAYDGVVGQDRPSITSGSCRFVVKKAKKILAKCPIGHILSKKQFIASKLSYDDDVLNIPDFILAKVAPEISVQNYETLREFLGSMQNAHDIAAYKFSEKSKCKDFISLYKENMSNIAKEYELIV